jgi:GNAT superfamily N-acetyltransferase
MPVAIIVRTAEDSDIATMAEIRAADWGDSSFWAERIMRYRRGEHSPQQALSKREIFVAVDDGIVVGFVAGHQTRRFSCDGELQWINVSRHKRGERIGDKLLTRMGAWFVEHNAQRVCVNVAAENSNARRLYARCGAEPYSEAWMVWDDARSIAGE